MTAALRELIHQARTELGSEACRAGKHQWESDGCRGCPQDEEEESCGQAVYRCTVCGAFDYGEPGGPGASDCAATVGCSVRWNKKKGGAAC